MNNNEEKKIPYNKEGISTATGQTVNNENITNIITNNTNNNVSNNEINNEDSNNKPGILFFLVVISLIMSFIFIIVIPYRYDSKVYISKFLINTSLYSFYFINPILLLIYSIKEIKYNIQNISGTIAIIIIRIFMDIYNILFCDPEIAMVIDLIIITYAIAIIIIANIVKRKLINFNQKRSKIFKIIIYIGLTLFLVEVISLIIDFILKMYFKI